MLSTFIHYYNVVGLGIHVHRCTIPIFREFILNIIQYMNVLQRCTKVRVGLQYTYCTVQRYLCLMKKKYYPALFSIRSSSSCFLLHTIRYSPRTTFAYSLGSNFGRLTGVPAGVRALLESREGHERRHRPQSIYSKHRDAATHAKISHRSL